MDIHEFTKFGKAVVDYIAEYMENIRTKQPISSVHPGYLRYHVPDEMPEYGEEWKNVLKDVKQFIEPGLSHWHSPRFHSYFPSSNSFPSVVGELILSGIGGLTNDDLESNPVVTELELKMMDWMAKMLGLPTYFLNESEGPGGGVIQSSASESTLLSLLAGKQRKIVSNSHLIPEEIQLKLVAYTSKESNSSVERCGLLSSIPIRLLPTDNENRLRGNVLREVIRKDKENGFIPCCVIATIGTTGTCAFDSLEELGEICQKENIWFHVDAAYAGAALVCPEYRYLIKGIEYVDSFCFSPHKWFLTAVDCSAMWVKNTNSIKEIFNIKSTVPSKSNLQNLQIPTSRRFRALKLWFMMRMYGVEGIQNHIRHQIDLAKYLERLIKRDDRFEVLVTSMGMICFRLKGKDSYTQQLLDKIAEAKKFFIMPYRYQDKLVIRFVICSRFTEMEDVNYAWNEICHFVDNK